MHSIANRNQKWINVIYSMEFFQNASKALYLPEHWFIGKLALMVVSIYYFLLLMITSIYHLLNLADITEICMDSKNENSCGNKYCLQHCIHWHEPLETITTFPSERATVNVSIAVASSIFNRKPS